ncbi:MAG: hypothetical protein A3J97_17340 [Spirochaetes bacterium RIFOXYC1_FULL_54_7]|nr:MAG: hypothetical protein A3J97_17340 [Spirochaetes bacterium RIFOXYC1_FULL_54_7]
MFLILLYAECLAENLLKDLLNHQFVYSISKLPSPFFKSDKRLFGEISRLLSSMLYELLRS